ncbi:MAG TPA: TAXI family TRAP transporter solute-binding subunit [Anaeromyxobacter sp.]|nr:TAXI family TRAP transporter solute-binding subunit [Anaeromyxobacter sp.]
MSVTTPPTIRRRRYLAAALVSILVLGAAAWTLGRRHGLPPRRIVMATGPEGGGYALIGARYREILARQGLDVQLRPTAGDLENLALLRDPRSGVSVALLQAGTTTEQDSPQLASLGTLFYQQVWIFQRGGRGAALKPGLRIAVGPEGSGTRALALKLLALAGVAPDSLNLVPLGPARGADELMAGTIDAVAIVAPWDAPAVRRLVAEPDVDLLGFRRADAFVALNPYLEKTVLPAGVGNMARNRPPQDVPLIETKTSLVVRRDLHDAVQYLLLEAASETHGGPGIFHKAGRFPAAEAIDLALSENARQYYRSGRPFLHRYLPYWAAVIVERILLVLVPIVGLVIPLARTLPQIYGGVMRRRIVRFYGELKMLETELEARPANAPTDDLVRRLDELELRASHLHVPLFYSQVLYTLKQHVRLVRGRMVEGR